MLRRGARRLSGPLAKKRCGYFFIWSRAILIRLERFAWRSPVPTRDRSGRRSTALPARAAGASYRELEAPAADVIPPPSWSWPSAFPASRRAERFAATRSRRRRDPRRRGIWLARAVRRRPDRIARRRVLACGRNGERRVLVESAEAVAVGVEELDGVTMSVWANGANYRALPAAERPAPRSPQTWIRSRSRPVPAECRGAPSNASRRSRSSGYPTSVCTSCRPVTRPAYRCETLRAATSPAIHEFGISWTAAFLNELFLPDPPDNGSRRIYVRRGVTNRAVLNEDEVLALLEPAGFEAVTMDGRSIGEQAALFASADVVVALTRRRPRQSCVRPPGHRGHRAHGDEHGHCLVCFSRWRRGLDYHMIMGTEPAPPDAGGRGKRSPTRWSMSAG